ncbi:MAG: hypothetical protein QNJ60_17895 [Xenococcaceae cyanobacterium MO_188.B19]|nr:hypothetical protein [Xenococcaceae cyanobacterium MO_188.B19]
MVLGSAVSVLAQISAPKSPQITLETEIKSLAQSDVKDAVPRRTDFIVELYSNNSQNLSSPDIRRIYDGEFSRQARKKHDRRVRWLAVVSAIILSCLALAAWSIRKKNLAILKQVSVTLPFGIGTVELDIRQVERNVAWSLYVELVTRIAIQPLESDQGLLREALTSLYSLFGTTRQILKEGGSVVGVSPKSVGGIAIAVLNQGLRPFLAEWHPALEEWEAKRPSTVSRKQHEKDWWKESQLRNKLENLRQDLGKYAEELAKIANV